MNLLKLPNPVLLATVVVAGGLLAACGNDDSGARALPQRPQSQQPQAPAAEPASASQWAKAQDLYLTYCASCHGDQMQGGSGGGLASRDDYQFGLNRDLMHKVIHDGLMIQGMPNFDVSLSDEEIYLLVDYIRAEGLGIAPEATGMAEPGGAEPESRTPEPTRTPSPNAELIDTYDYVVAKEVFAEGLDVPWGIAFTGMDDALVTERSGALRVIRDGRLRPEPVADAPEVWARGQGGLLDVAVDPEYAENRWVYLAYSHPGRGGAQTRVVRGRIENNRWTDEQVLWHAAEDTYSGAGVHFGSRLVFPPDGTLMFGIGDRGQQNLAQDLSAPNGKVFRINQDGTIPEDNPFVGTAGALPAIFSYGHRNPQGMAVHPVTGEVWETEHGPRGGDELNLLRPGLNYGWPVITYGINYNGTIITRDREREGMEQPVWMWRPSTGTCGLDWYMGEEFPYWKGHLLAGGLATRDLRLLKMQNNRVIHEETILKNRRTRAVRTGPDGAIYVLVEDPGQVLRLTRRAEQEY